MQQLRDMTGRHYGATDTFNALTAADPRNYSHIRSGNPGALTQSDLERTAEQSGQWYGIAAGTRYAPQYLNATYGANPYSLQKSDIEITSAAEQARSNSNEAARRAFAGLNPDGTPMARPQQAYVQPHAGASLGYDNLYASNDTAYDRPEAGMDFNPMQVQQQADARNARRDQMAAAGRANVLQRFNNSNQQRMQMGGNATANMPRINDVGYGGSARGALPPNISGPGGINNTALMGPNAKPTFKYGVSQNISMPFGSSPGAVGYGGASRPMQGQFGGFQGGQAGGQAPPGMYTQGWQSRQGGQVGGTPGMGSQAPSGMPQMGRFGQPQPRIANPNYSGISPYVR